VSAGSILLHTKACRWTPIETERTSSNGSVEASDAFWQHSPTDWPPTGCRWSRDPSPTWVSGGDTEDQMPDRP
jgi:hypothetical protein